MSTTDPRHYDVIISPVITEKATLASEVNQVVFKVAKHATKPQIKEAVEKLFDVKVKSVNTHVRKGKVKAFKGTVGEQSEVLEDHRRRVAAHLPQLFGARGRHVLACDLDPARRRLDQPDQRADERRLTGAGEAHDDEDLARPDLEGDIADRGDATMLLAQLGARKIGVGRSHHAVGMAPEDLPDALDADQRLAAPVDLVAEGCAGVGHRCHRSTVPRFLATAKLRTAPRSCRLRRCRR